MRLEAADLAYLAPELTLVIFAVVLSLVDLFMPKTANRAVLGWLSLAGLVLSAGFVISFIVRMNAADPAQTEAFVQLLNQSLRIDDFANLFKLLLLAGSALIVLMSIGSTEKQGIEHSGEYYYLLLPATLGGMMMASSGDLMTLFVGTELLSITSYILVGIRKKNLQSNEAAFKYLVTGSIASAMILYGMSFLYGMTGSTNIAEINTALQMAEPSFSGLIYVSFFLMLAGFGFKMGAAPFHTWAPDVYQGAAAPVTAFLAVVSKAAALAVFFRVTYNVYYGVGSVETPIYLDIFLAVNVVAAIAMILGNAMALRQKNLKRLLAYSGIANAGYLLVPLGVQIGSFHYDIFSEMFFYLAAYLFMNIGAFAVIMAVSRSAGHEQLSGFAGLYYRAPWTALAMVILVLSLAGLPVTGGFFGKLYIMLGALQVKEYWLAAVIIVTSVVSYYYYFGVIRQMFMRTGFSGKPFRLTAPLAVTIWLSAGASLLMGFFPHWLLQLIEHIFSLSGDLFIYS
jgi:NADH-quinone oxidoreductase subunit N